MGASSSALNCGSKKNKKKKDKKSPQQVLLLNFLYCIQMIYLQHR